MKFKTEDYNENVIYCEYVFRYAEEKGLELGKEDIQNIANQYAFKLEEKDLYNPDEVVENNSILADTIHKYLKKARARYTQEIDPEDIDVMMNAREKDFFAHAGNDILDTYDDKSYDEILDKVNQMYGRK